MVLFCTLIYLIFLQKKKKIQFLLLWLKNISAFSGTREGQGRCLSTFTNKIENSGEKKVFELPFKRFIHGPFKRSSLRWEKIHKTELYASVKHGEPTVYTTNQILPFETAHRLNLVQTVGVP